MASTVPNNSALRLPWTARSLTAFLEPGAHPSGDVELHAHAPEETDGFLARLDDIFRALEDHDAKSVGRVTANDANTWEGSNRFVGPVGFGGQSPIVLPIALPAAASDLASVITLANALRSLLIRVGIAQ
jgi:hypothetical protein